MKLLVNPHKIELIQDEAVNEKEINISKCVFEFNEDITDDFVKEAYFTLNDDTYKKIIVNNECTFPQEVLIKEGTVELGVVATYTDLITDEITRYNPTPVYFKTDLGSLKTAQNSQPITPSEMEQYEQELQDGLVLVNSKLDDINTAIAETNNLNLDATKSGSTTTMTITKKDGTTKQVQIKDGEKGEQGDRGPQGIQGEQGIRGIQGEQGPQGVQGPTGATGQTGPQGPAGRDGTDGVSPTATISKSGNTATITITDKTGTTTATVSDGTNGADGRDGYVQYTAGNNITIENNVISASGGVQTLVDQTIQIGSSQVTSNISAGIYIIKGDNTQIKYGNNATHKPLTNCGADGQAVLLVVDIGVSSGTGLYAQNAYVFISSPSANESRIHVYDKSNITLVKPANLIMKDTVASITAVHTYSTLPESSVTPTANNQLTNKVYVDTAISNAITTTLGGSF